MFKHPPNQQKKQTTIRSSYQDRKSSRFTGKLLRLYQDEPKEPIRIIFTVTFCSVPLRIPKHDDHDHFLRLCRFCFFDSLEAHFSLTLFIRRWSCKIQSNVVFERARLVCEHLFLIFPCFFWLKNT